ncbi:processed acidic surface protein [Bacillus solitudinis]|uniref:processed acidic surface protein n=1 Tax=Bacillus solitudinis TaxID=2014074 RepID=UPI000C24BFDF|nr:processed acidic surface protein [Bacillus solitudinis]
MRNTLMVLLCTSCLFATMTFNALAAPPQEEVDQLLSEMNWTMEELHEYLAYYELTLDEFETTEELKWMLGTPITEENLAELLQTHGLTYEELEALLAEFGEGIEEYHFIEDLDMSLDFYLNHEGDMEEIEDLLANIGLTDEEIEHLFTHLLSIDETELESEMNQILTRLEPFMTVEDPNQLPDEQQQELFSIWEDMLAAYHLKANFYLVNGTKTQINYGDLTNLEALNGSDVLIELHDLQGNFILDMQLSNEMLTSDFLFSAGSELINVGDLAGELTNELHEMKLPDTATPYGFNMLLGSFLIFVGFIFYLFSRKTAKVN